jgi:hypothetical protein
VADVSTDFAADNVLAGDSVAPDTSEDALDIGDRDLDKCFFCRMFS